jgi:DNA helicase II / ATP-dependent DNA helicase PcrA
MTQASLTDEQRSVVEATAGHFVVLAGPGSGKTHTITEKILYLFERKVIPEYGGLLAITFTNEAANVMRSRLRTKGFRQWDRAWIGTFHGFGSYVLSCYGGDVGVREDFEVIEPDVRREIIKKVVAAKLKAADPSNIADVIERFKRQGIYPGRGDEQLDPGLKSVYADYQHSMKEINSVDFGDLVALAVQLLKDSSPVYRLFTSFFRYIIVDEFQDTDRQQLEMVRMLAEVADGSTIVADDDQSIYRFRGADRANVYVIEKLLNAQRVVLGVNFRSDQVIVEAANAVIGHEANRALKVTRATSENRGSLYRREFSNPDDEASYIASSILALGKKGQIHDWGNISIITRVRWRADQLLKMLDSYKIPWFDRARLKFQDSWETYLGFALLTLACDLSSSDGLYEVMTAIEDGGLAYRLCARDALDLATAFRTRFIQGLDFEPHPSCAKAILEIAELDKIIESASWSATESRRLLKNLFIMLADLDAESRALNLNMTDAINRLAGRGAVQVLSGQASKGREFDHVYLIGLEDDIIPHYLSKKDEDIAEERRIFYVALTRARRSAFLTNCRERPTRAGNMRRTTPSRFIAHIPPEYFTPLP